MVLVGMKCFFFLPKYAISQALNFLLHLLSHLGPEKLKMFRNDLLLGISESLLVLLEGLSQHLNLLFLLAVSSLEPMSKLMIGLVEKSVYLSLKGGVDRDIKVVPADNTRAHHRLAGSKQHFLPLLLLDRTTSA
jgi:hypothetical protein